MQTVLITGSEGFIGKNFVSFLGQRKEFEIIKFKRSDELKKLETCIDKVDWIFHFAGVNRSVSQEQFVTDNVIFTKALCSIIAKSGKTIPVIFTSSIHVDKENEYGISKKRAEAALLNFSKKSKNPVYIYRLPHVFGKWSKPNYNSVIATFCYNVARNIPIQVSLNKTLELLYIDDLLLEFEKLLNSTDSIETFPKVSPIYKAEVAEIADLIEKFNSLRMENTVPSVGKGLKHALYATFISFLPKTKFNYSLKINSDKRGIFSEILKNTDFGQFSFFTILPNNKRGGHFHQTKVEKFLVVKGDACFKFRHVISDERYEIQVSGKDGRVVETIPGWAHEVINVGEDVLICVLWANEVFNPDNPDTIPFPN